MSLDDEIKQARTEVVSDGYEMSVGELINLYKDKEILINPVYQRLFRWDDERQSRFLESILLGIPIPSIFVYQDDKGKWELIDGLQRLSTILKFVGILRKGEDEFYEASKLEGTKFLPSLSGKVWNGEEGDDSWIGGTQQLQVKRTRMRVEILKKESDPKAKFELFQRLNTGGANLSPQEVRNCVAVMLDEAFFKWLTDLASGDDFTSAIDQTSSALEQQMHVELALRLLAFRAVPYQSGLNVHEYLDEALINLATDKEYDQTREGDVFRRTFKLLNESLGSKAFKKWDGGNFSGKFLMSVFEVVSTGVSQNLSDIEGLGENRTAFIVERCKLLWDDEVFKNNNGAGVRGTTRLTNLLPMAEGFFSVRK